MLTFELFIDFDLRWRKLGLASTKDPIVTTKMVNANNFIIVMLFFCQRKYKVTIIANSYFNNFRQKNCLVTSSDPGYLKLTSLLDRSIAPDTVL